MSNSIIKSALEGDVARVHLLVKDGKSLDITDNNGWTLVHHLAASGGHVTLAEIFRNCTSRDKKDAVSRLTWCRETPLFMAVMSESTSKLTMVQLLLSWGADPNAQNIANETVLSIASSQKGNLKVVRSLRDMGALLGDDITPVVMAIEVQDMDIIRYLLKSFSCQHMHLITSLCLKYPALNELVRDIVEKIPSRKDWLHLVGQAAKLNNHEGLTILLENCPDGDRDVHCIDTMQSVLAGIKDVSEMGENLLYFVSLCDMCGYFETKQEAFEFLLKYSSDLRNNIQISRKYVHYIDPKLHRSYFEMLVPFRYFPEKDQPRGSLMRMCRPVVRSYLVHHFKNNAWEAYSWLQCSNLPTSIKKYLLYCTDSPLMWKGFELPADLKRL